MTIVRIRVLMRSMYICSCNAVTDHDIRREVAGGVQSFAQLQERTGCGDCCGSCVAEARTALAKAANQDLSGSMARPATINAPMVIRVLA